MTEEYFNEFVKRIAEATEIVAAKAEESAEKLDCKENLDDYNRDLALFRYGILTGVAAVKFDRNEEFEDVEDLAKFIDYSLGTAYKHMNPLTALLSTLIEIAVKRESEKAVDKDGGSDD